MKLEQILTDTNLEGEVRIWGLFDNGERKRITQEEKEEFLKKAKEMKRRKPY